MKRNNEPIAALALSISALLLMTGCSISGASASDHPAQQVAQSASPLLDSHGVTTEQKHEVSDFPFELPVDIKWPADAPDFMKNKNARFEDGVASGSVANYWLCAWEDNYMNAVKARDQKQQTIGLDMIAKFMDLPFYKAHFDDPNQEWYNTVVVTARAGDNSGVEAYLKQCGYFYGQQG